MADTPVASHALPFAHFHCLPMPEQRARYDALLADMRDLREQLRLLSNSLQQAETTIATLKARLSLDSTNSSKPPSSDSPYRARPPKSRNTGKKTRPYHKGASQPLMSPDSIVDHHPEQCPHCHSQLRPGELAYTHQHVEFVERPVHVTHDRIFNAWCPVCHKKVTAQLPVERATGFGPRFSAVALELLGVHADSRRNVQDFFHSVFGVRISQGALQKIVRRGTEALQAHRQRVEEEIHRQPVAYVDETPWKLKKVLNWLWVMVCPLFALFRIDRHRSAEAFNALIGQWTGVLVSDGYCLYRTWLHGRQTCLAHLIRKARAAEEMADKIISQGGSAARKLLQQLGRMADAPPGRGELAAWHMRYRKFVGRYGGMKNILGKLARQLQREEASLRTFLTKHGVEPTNNRAERALRHGVLWRKRGFGNRTEEGERFVERILTVRETCRLQGKRTYPILCAALEAHMAGKEADATVMLPEQSS